VDDPGSDRLSAGGLHFTVGSATGHDSAGSLDLQEDLALVKASLLYADRVKLCSLGASVLSGIAQFQEASTEEQARLVVRFLPDLEPLMSSQEIHFFEAVVGLRGREEKRRISKRTCRKILAMVSERGGELEAMVLEQHRAAGIEGFREAVNSGVLEVHPFRQTSAQSLIEATIRGGGNRLYGLDVADLLKEFLDQVKSAVEDGFTYPMFDDLTGNFVAEAIRLGLIRGSEASIARGQYSGLSGELLQRLPLFEEATVAEVLDIRRELEGPLRGFRLAVSDFSSQIRSAGWEPKFAEEADALFREKVQPEIERIEEAVLENRSLEELARRVVRHGATRATFGALVGSVSDLSVLAGLAMGLGSAGVQAYLDQQERLRDIQDKQLYFYYGAQELLRSPGREA
jgi:hypothetical protein